MAYAAALMEPGLDVDKLSYEIFSILESKFLFGYDDHNPLLAGTPPETPSAGKVRILSVDSGNGLLAAISLARLESSLRKRSGDPSARIADFFDVAAGSGSGGVLAAMLFTSGPDGRPLFSAEEALRYLSKNRRGMMKMISSAPRKLGIFRGCFRPYGGRFGQILGNATLRDTVKPVLVPCYDLATGAPFLFSRADAVEADSYDFLMREVCAATCAATPPVEVRSVDGRTRVAALGGGAAMKNPTAAAITHVLNNKQEFPLAAGVEDLLVVSLADGDKRGPSPSPEYLVTIAADGMAEMVDQAVAMAFGQNRTTNYVRIEANGIRSGRAEAAKGTEEVAAAAEAVLSERNVESVLFRGKKFTEQTNSEKLEWFSGELIKEHERRKATAPTVVVKGMTPRTSSSTTATSSSSSTSSS